MQSALENAVRLELADALTGLPAEFEHFEHSETYEAFIKRLIDKMRGDRWHALTKRASIIILVAALLFVLLVVGFAASTAGREFVVTNFSNRFQYTVSDKSKTKFVHDLNVGYIPEGYTLNHEEKLKSLYYNEYTDGTDVLRITKGVINGYFDFDSYVSIEEIYENGITYVFAEEVNMNSLIWNNGEYVFKITSTIDKDELLKIAQNTD